MTAITNYQIDQIMAAPYQAQAPKMLREEHLWVYVLTGEFRYTVNGAAYTLRAGASLLVPLGSVYTWQNLGNQPGRLLLARAYAREAAECVYCAPGANRLGRTLSIAGDPLNVILRGQETGNTFCAMEIRTSPNQGPPLHIHNREDEYFHVLEGMVEFEVDGKRRMVQAGQSIVGVKNGVHTFRNAGEEPSRMLVLAFPAGMDEFFIELDAAHPQDALKVFERFGLVFSGPPLAFLPA